MERSTAGGVNLSQLTPQLHPNDEMGTLDGEHGIIIGQTRFGKTYLAKRIARFYPHVLIHDPKQRFTLYGDPELERRIYTVDELYDVDPERERVIIYSPPTAEAEDPGAQEEFCARAFEREHCTVVIDEIVRLGNTTRYPKSLRYLYTGGAEKGICVLGLTQEPVNVPSFVLTQTACVYCFYLSNDSHRDKVAGFMPIDTEQIAALQKYQFYFWRNDMRDATGPHWL